MRTVLFTGATGGLGSLCVKALSQRGSWTVFAAGTNEAALAKLGRLPRVVPVAMDITREESVAAALKEVKARTDRLDALAHFAGVSGFTSLVEGEGVAAITKMLAVNVTGAARVNQAFFPLLRPGEGRILHCSSEAGWMTPQPFAGPYALSKHAMEAYNDSLRRELMFLKIRVIKLQPGSYATRLTGQLAGDFSRTLAATKYYGPVLTAMKPLMDMELKKRNDPGRLVKTVIRALEAPRPHLRYRVGTGKLLMLLELLPAGGVDALYRLIVRFRSAKKKGG